MASFQRPIFLLACLCSSFAGGAVATVAWRGPVAGAAEQDSKTAANIQASRFELVDGKGAVRARWSVDDDGSVSLGLLDPNQKLRAGMSLDASAQPRLFVADEAGNRRASLTFKDDSPALGLVQANGKPMVILSASADARGLQLLGSAGEPLALLGVDKEELPHLHMRKDKLRADLCLEEGRPSLTLRNSSIGSELRAFGLSVYGEGGKERLYAGLAKDGTPELVLKNPKAEDLLRLGYKEERPYVLLTDASRKARAAIGLDESDQPTFAIKSGAGKGGGFLRCDGEGYPRFVVTDGEENVTWGTPRATK